MREASPRIVKEARERDADAQSCSISSTKPANCDIWTDSNSIAVLRSDTLVLPRSDEGHMHLPRTPSRLIEDLQQEILAFLERVKPRHTCQK